MKMIGHAAAGFVLAAAFACSGARAEVAPAPDAGQSAAVPGAWKEQTLDFDYMGFTDRYSCTGLRDTVERVLRALGARADYSLIETGCVYPGIRRNMNFPGVRMKFAVLVPAAAAAPGAVPVGVPAPAGAWRDVNLIGRGLLDPEECELAEQIIEQILPRFTVRNVDKATVCAPYIQSSNRQLHVEVFAPLAQAQSN